MKPQTLLRLKTYTATSVVSLAAFTANSSIVYTDVNPGDTTFTGQFPANFYDIDFNNDGIVDIQLTNYTQFSVSTSTLTSYSNYRRRELKGIFAGKMSAGNGAMVTASSYDINALVYGSPIDNTGLFASSYSFGAIWYSNYSYRRVNYGTSVNTQTSQIKRGNFTHGNPAYMGVKFNIDSLIHFGWVRIAIDTATPSVTIMDYAYETCVDYLILAGHTSGGGSATTSGINLSDCDSLYFSGNWYYSDTTATDTILAGAASGCDSLVTASITIINSPDPTNQSVTTCDSAMVNGNVYYSSQVVTDVFSGSAANGCDSTEVTNLTINYSVTNNQSFTACDSMLYDGNWYYSDTVVTKTMSAGAVNGCDSTATANITIRNSATKTVNLDDCDSVFHNGTYYYTSISYTDTIDGAAPNGCDSLITYNINVHTMGTGYDSLFACDMVLIHGNYYNSSQTVTDTLNLGGYCDTIIITDLTVGETTYSSSVITINEGDSVFVGGAYQTQEGDYKDTLQNSSGCDSIITTYLDVLNSVQNDIHNQLNIKNLNNNQLQINSSYQPIKEIELINISGYSGFSEQMVNGTVTKLINIADLNAGIYFLRVTFIDNKQATVKVIIQ